MPKKYSAHKTPNLVFVGLFAVLFVFSLVGFSGEFIKFIRTQQKIALVMKQERNVAGVSKQVLTIEVRGNNNERTYEVSSALDSNSNFRVTNLSATNNVYTKDLMIDLTGGEKKELVVTLENTLHVGSQEDLPENEQSSSSDVLVILAE